MRGSKASASIGSGPNDCILDVIDSSVDTTLIVPDDDDDGSVVVAIEFVFLGRDRYPFLNSTS